MKSGAERVESLLRKLGLEDRRIGHSSEIDLSKKIDYENLSVLDEFIEFSKQYLHSALNT